MNTNDNHNSMPDAQYREMCEVLDRVASFERAAPNAGFEARVSSASAPALIAAAARAKGLKLVGETPRGVRLGAGLRVAAAMGLAATLLAALLARGPTTTVPGRGGQVTDADLTAIFGESGLDAMAEADQLNLRIKGDWSIGDALLDDGAM